jgi:hypothetical protein
MLRRREFKDIRRDRLAPTFPNFDQPRPCRVLVSSERFEGNEVPGPA